MMFKLFVPVLVVTFAVLAFAPRSNAQSTGFVYQGSLRSGASHANGNYDLEFKLFDALSGGSQLGATVTVLNVAVINGIFAAQLDFGNQFGGANRYLEIGLRVAGGGGGYQQLLPRQQVASNPYGIRSLTAANADNALNLGGVAANQYVITTDPRLNDPRDPLPGSGSYIQNKTTPAQPSSNFNISGTGKADIFDAGTQFNISGFRVFSAPGTGLSNTFAGYRSGNLSLTGTQNTAVGFLSGESLTTGSGNALFGMGTGPFLTTGGSNTFAGTQAGYSTTTGGSNTLMGGSAGYFNVTGTANAYFGNSAGRNTTGSNNSFFGAFAGENTTTGLYNTFIGTRAGAGNSTGNTNTAIGDFSGFSSNNFSYATAIGAEARAISSNSIMLGRPNGADHVQIPGNLTVTGTLDAPLSNTYIHNTTNQQAAANFNISGDGVVGGTLAAGLFNSSGEYRINGLRVIRAPNFNMFVGIEAGGTSNTGVGNSFFGTEAGGDNTSGNYNSFFGGSSGANNTTGTDNSFFGHGSGAANTIASGNSAFGTNAGASNTAGQENSFFGIGAGAGNTVANGNTYIGAYSGGVPEVAAYSTAIGWRAFVATSNSIVLGSVAGQNGGLTTPNVGIGTTAPSERLHVAGTIYSSSGGFKFPDGSIQSTAAGTNTTYTASRQNLGTLTNTYTPVLHLDLPAGNYSVMFSIEVSTDIAIGRRNVTCVIGSVQGDIYGLYLTPENNLFVLSFHTVLNLPSQSGLDVLCVGDVALDSYYRTRRLTAAKLGDVIVQ